MNAWILVPCLFGLWWLASGLSAFGPLPKPAWAALIVAAMLVAACGLARRRRAQIVDRRAFRVAVLAETAGIAAVLFGCGLSQRPDLIMPLTGAVVGLHLLPLAKAFDDRRFLIPFCLLTGVCLASLLWPPPLRMAIAGIGAGCALWAFAVWTSFRQGTTADRSTVRP